MKIKIKQSKSADTRSADHKITLAELLQSSNDHITDVQQAMYWMRLALNSAAFNHDNTKISGIHQFHQDFADQQDGKITDFRTQSKWFQHHINTERHHLNARCPDDVNLFDVMEMIADIVTAGMARTGKVFDEPIDPDILVRAYKNTIDLLKSKIEVE